MLITLLAKSARCRINIPCVFLIDQGMYVLDRIQSVPGHEEVLPFPRAFEVRSSSRALRANKWRICANLMNRPCWEQFELVLRGDMDCVPGAEVLLSGACSHIQDDEFVEPKQQQTADYCPKFFTCATFIVFRLFFDTRPSNIQIPRPPREALHGGDSARFLLSS